MSDPKKPLFIPLKREWFEAFRLAGKDREYRPASWLKRAMAGRRAILSLGYSGARMLATVVEAKHIPIKNAPEGAQRIYAGRETVLTEILLELE